MLHYEAHSRAAPGDVWPLLAHPARWSSWAPHIRGAWGLGAPEVRAGATGAARLLGFLPVPARITAVDPGRSWEWRVGPVLMDHRVEPEGGGSRVVVELRAAGGLERVLALTYGPVVDLLVRNCARVASD